MKISTCAHCGKVLAECDTIWACGPMFCSAECGIQWAKSKYDESEYDSEEELEHKALGYFYDIAEEVEVETIGVSKEISAAYSPEADVTTIFQSVNENDDNLFIEVVGWYFGEPDPELIEQYTGSLRATLYRCEDLED